MPPALSIPRGANRLRPSRTPSPKIALDILTIQRHRRTPRRGHDEGQPLRRKSALDILRIQQHRFASRRGQEEGQRLRRQCPLLPHVRTRLRRVASCCRRWPFTPTLPAAQHGPTSGIRLGSPPAWVLPETCFARLARGNRPPVKHTFFCLSDFFKPLKATHLRTEGDAI